MDDLSGLSWSNPSNGTSTPTSTPAATTNSSFYAPLRPTPSPLASGRNTPLLTQPSASANAFKAPPAKPAHDSFSNLVNFGAAKSTANLSLKERQELLEAERRKREDEKRKQAQAQFGDGRFFDSLGGIQSGTPRTSSPTLASAASRAIGTQNEKPIDSDDDLFAAFNANTKVDSSSHFPPPQASSTLSLAPALDLSNAKAWGTSMTSGGGLIDDDDDPFGLNQIKPKLSAPPVFPADEDDDFLGDLAKPVDQVRKPQPKPQPQAPPFSRTPQPGKAIEDSSSDSEPESAPTSKDPFDKAVAQLVDYGFTPENARRGLTESGAGLNVQAAVNWLLDDAHRQTKEKAKGGKQNGRGYLGNSEVRASSQPRGSTPSWMREGEGSWSQSRDDRNLASSEADFTKAAAAVGSSLLKSANSLWKQGQKKVQKAVSEFQQDGDPSQPKWMRSAQQERGGGDAKRRIDVTDEAMMLESGSRSERRPELVESRSSSNTASRDHSPVVSGPRESSGLPKWQQANQAPSLDLRSRLSKQAVEEQSSQAYISPARRKRTPQPQQEATPPPGAVSDLLFNPTPVTKPQPTLPSQPAQSAPASRPTPRQSPAPRPAPTPHPQRHIPSVSAIALQSSAQHRMEGTAHFKRGDYAAAHASYTSSLTSIPQTHPLAILLLCNRSLTALKTGEPRQAIGDADAAISLIGPGKGEGEHVELGGRDNEKRDMRELYGKALTRKAEALEQMEKWSEAATVWQLCVESGHGGPLAIAGRQRCQKALEPKPASRKPKAAPPRPRPTPTASGNKSSEAVEKLRAANKAAENEGKEKLELIDKVDARIAAWRDGKRDNLRALLSSMENVLWEGSEWKKVGLHELVMTNKVKIIYMKAIAKTHPDKVGHSTMPHTEEY